MKFLKKGKFECYKDVHFKTQPGPDRTQTYVRQRLLHVAQSVECWSRDPKLDSQPEALDLHFSQLVPVGS